MSDLLNLLRQRIEMTGPISVADYMAQCLCHPRHGYYMKKDPFGIQGDFITAPEISQTFGELLGLWAAICWQQMGSPSPLHLVELGPGRGTLMMDALRASKAVPGFHDALTVHLVEISPVLKDLQQKKLSGSPVDIQWHGDLADLPDGPAFFLANEFFDALPIRQFEKGEKGWAERFVDLDPDGEGLRFVLQSDEAASALMPPGLREKDAPLGAFFEISSPAQSVAYALGQRLCEQGGAVLALDYGYDTPGFGETFQALHKHQYSPVLDAPGNADLTAHVDFNTLAHSFVEGGARVWGPQGQGMFLERLGIAQRFQILLQNASDTQRPSLIAAHKRLTAPEEMGKLFKVICATHPDHPAPAAFEDA